MSDLAVAVLGKYNYWLCIILMMIGIYAMIAKKNLIKKLVGMNIFQTSIILFLRFHRVQKRGGRFPFWNTAPAITLLNRPIISIRCPMY